MKTKNVLICLDRLGIGGVETFVYNQSLTLKSKGYNIIILSSDGIYRKKLEEQGIKWIEFNFEAKDYLQYEKINQIVEIMKTYEITEVHVNQLPEVNYIYPACLIENIPYVAYLHFQSGAIQNNENNVYDYFEKNYSTYKERLKVFWKYAYKIVAITKEVRDYTIQRYNLQKEKCIVIPNSINFLNFESVRSVTKMEKIVLVSRLDSEKETSILNGIKLYKELRKYTENIRLTVVGDGNIRKKIEQDIAGKDDITFVGPTTNVKKYLEEADLVIGVDRCMIEAIAMKRLAVVSGYEYMGQIITSKCIGTEIDENFCGKSLGPTSIEQLAKELSNLDMEKIREIVEENYNEICNRLDINKNMYCVDNDEFESNIRMEDLLKEFIKMDNILGKKEEDSKQNIEKIWQDHVLYKEWMEKEVNVLKESNLELEEKNKQTEEEIQRMKDEIQNSKLYKIKEKLFWKKMKR